MAKKITDLTVIDGGRGADYVPVLLQEKVLSALKDIAIYRLSRVEKALERLNTAVSRLDAAAESIPEGAPADDTDTARQSDQYELAKAELAALRADYDRLHAAATTVAGRLDETIERLESSTTSPSSASKPASA